MKVVREETPNGSFGFSVPDEWKPVRYQNPGGLAGRSALFPISAAVGAALGALIFAITRHGGAEGQAAAFGGALAGAMVGLMAAWKLVLPLFRVDGTAYGCGEAVAAGSIARVEADDPLEGLKVGIGEDWSSATNKRSYKHGPGLLAAEVTVRDARNVHRLVCVIGPDFPVLLALSVERAHEKRFTKIFDEIASSITIDDPFANLPPETREHARKLAHSLLRGSGDGPDDEAPVTRELAERVVKALRKQWPRFHFSIEKDLRIGAWNSKDEAEPVLTLGLGSVAREIATSPTRPSKVIADYAESMPLDKAMVGPDEVVPLVREQLFPTVLPDGAFADMSDEERPASKAFCDGFSKALVVGSEHGSRYVQQGDLKRLGLTWDEAFAGACKNLDALLDAHALKRFARTDGGGRRVVIEGHDFAAGALLLPNLAKRLEGLVGGDFFVCIPTRDRFIAFERSSEGFVRKVVSAARAEHRKRPHPITDGLFRVGPGGVRPVRVVAHR